MGNRFDMYRLLAELDAKPQSFSDIARKYGISRKYVSKIAKPLLEAGIIEPCEQGYRISTAGRVLYKLLTAIEEGKHYVERFTESIEDYLKEIEERDKQLKFMNPEELVEYYTTRIDFLRWLLYKYLFFSLLNILELYVGVKYHGKKSLDAHLKALWISIIKPLISNLVEVLVKSNEIEWKTVVGPLYCNLQLAVIQSYEALEARAPLRKGDEKLKQKAKALREICEEMGWIHYTLPLP
jgi:DNA-binding transcriptional ArsR family regulator